MEQATWRSLIRPDTLDSLTDDPRTEFLLKCAQPHHRTLAIYHGMGHWLYIHREGNKWGAYVFEPQSNEYETNKNILKPYHFYRSDALISETCDHVYIGVSPQDFPKERPRCLERFVHYSPAAPQ